MSFEGERQASDLQVRQNVGHRLKAMRRRVTKVLRLRVIDASDQQPALTSSTTHKTTVSYDFSDDEDDFFASESGQVCSIYCYNFSTYPTVRSNSFDK